MQILPALAVVLAGLVAPTAARAQDAATTPPDDLLSSDLLHGAPGMPIGYGAYAGTFYDMGLSMELASWPTGGADQVFLSGLSYEENKGLLTNLIAMVLAASGGPSGDYVMRGGQREYNPEAAAKFRQEYLSNVARGAATLPLSLGLRVFHDSFGSDMTGWALEIGIGNTLGAPELGRGAWQVSLSAGSLSSNRRWAPLVEPEPGVPTPMPKATYSRGWFGASIDCRIGVAALPWAGARFKATAAFSSPFLLLVEGGPEIHVGNRLHVRAMATSDLRTFATGEIGGRVEGVVRF